MALVAASGYSSIQKYVPYSMWTEVTPLIESIIHNSLSNYRHELLIGNIKGIPVYQQHGAKDDNVPAYHSRRMNSLLHQSGCASQYFEMPDRGHWFEGTMTTEPLQAFYASVLESGASKKQPPKDFHFIIPNSGDMGSRMGISVDQLQSPDILGRLSVERDDGTNLWCIRTSNVRRIQFCLAKLREHLPKTISVDGNVFRNLSLLNETKGLSIVRLHDSWDICNSYDWKILSARYGRQRGSLDAILRTIHAFRIRVCSNNAFEAARQVSLNLMQYYGADTEILLPGESLESFKSGNVITLAVGTEIPPALVNDFPVQTDADGIKITYAQGSLLKLIPGQPGLGSAFLRPLPEENLELVLWGYDPVGLHQAIRMAPTLPGGGQPDFVVLGNEARWKGCGGVAAMGFFDHSWQISQASYLP